MIEKLKPWSGSIILVPLVIFFILNNGKFIFILDHFNLLIHEGGHGIFRFFGKFIYTLGGSLMQIIIPALFVFYFYSNHKIFGTQVSMIFLGQNLLNISVYAADAQKQLLPLLGGNKVYHDWNYLLNKLDILNHSQAVGNFFVIISIIIFILALLIPLFMKKHKEVKINLNL